MIVSYNWLKELVKLNISAEDLSRDMSLYSCEVETFNKMSNATNLIIGKVLDIRVHENSDHLHVCNVDLGDRVEQIVCGAPNVDKDQLVIVALPGAVLPGGEIKKSKVRGVESNGMICSLQELGIENKYVEAKYQNGIYVLDNNAKVGSSALEYLMFDDYLIELSLTPNRMDLMSMLGVAQDVSAMYNIPLIPLEYKCDCINEEASSCIDVEINTKDCLSYYAKCVKDVKIMESPQFIKARLIASGIRPINNVVDITNYVLMLFGQPLHAFDKDKLGSKIIVRNALNDEHLVTLDDIDRKLLPTDIVISDDLDNNRSICLAGVMGGKSTEIDDNTVNIVLESAVFNPLTVRKTSSRLGLRSESSTRYERGVDLNRSLQAVEYACYLLSLYADGKVCSGYVHKGISHIDDKEIIINDVMVNQYLGINIDNEEITHICNNLGFKVVNNKETLHVFVPNRRMDVVIKQDLIEEIARMHGYDKLNETLPCMNVCGEFTHNQEVNNLVNSTLKNLGLNEVITYSLVNPKSSKYFDILNEESYNSISLLHPMTEEHSVLRMSLVPSILDVVKYNNARKINDLAFYEVGKVYYKYNDEVVEETRVSGALEGMLNGSMWNNTKVKADFFYAKGILETLFERLSINVTYTALSNSSYLHPGRSANIILNDKVVGYIGEVHPTIVQEYDINTTVVFELSLEELYKEVNPTIMFNSISKVPFVERDLALVMDTKESVGSVVETIKRCDKKMIKEVEIFDIYEGSNIESGKKSVAVRIKFESLEALTDDIINSKVKKILNTLSYLHHIELRK